MSHLLILVGTISKFLLVGLQALAYAQQSRECSNYEQASLLDRMQEYKKQIDRETRQSSISSQVSTPVVDRTSMRNSHRVIEEAMQSAAEGKVLSCIVLGCIYSSLTRHSS